MRQACVVSELRPICRVGELDHSTSVPPSHLLLAGRMSGGCSLMSDARMLCCPLVMNVDGPPACPAEMLALPPSFRIISLSGITPRGVGGCKARPPTPRLLRWCSSTCKSASCQLAICPA